MITKAEWDALEGVCGRNAIVATTLMGYAVVENQTGLFESPQGEMVYRHELPSFTTDRNVCALVLDEIKKKGRDTAQKMLLEMAGFEGLMVDRHWPDTTTGRPGVTSILWCGLNADPDLICYCAVKAVEES